jgi:hypothetical protein
MNSLEQSKLDKIKLEIHQGLLPFIGEFNTESLRESIEGFLRVLQEEFNKCNANDTIITIVPDTSDLNIINVSMSLTYYYRPINNITITTNE